MELKCIKGWYSILKDIYETKGREPNQIFDLSSLLDKVTLIILAVLTLRPFQTQLLISIMPVANNRI